MKQSHELSSPETIRLKMLAFSCGAMISEDRMTSSGNRLKEKLKEIRHDIDVNVRNVLYPDLHNEIVASMMAGGTEYDVFMMDNIWMSEFVEAGWLKDITKYIPPGIKKGFFSAALEAAEYPAGSGKYYALPWYIDTKYFFYNKRMLAKAGIKKPPKTLDELLSQAMTMKKKGIVKYPIVWSWAQHECLICDYLILTTLFGGRLVDEAGKPIFNEGGAVAALKWMAKSIDIGITNYASLAFTEPDMARTLGAGDAAFALDWLSHYEELNRPEFLAGGCGIANVPGSDLLPEGASINGSTFIAVSANCRNTSAAMELIKFWTGADPQESYVKWLFPVHMRLFDTPKMLLEGIFDITDIVKYQYEHMITRPRIPRYAAFSKELQQAIHEALTKAKTPQKALNEAAKRFIKQC